MFISIRKEESSAILINKRDSQKTVPLRAVVSPLLQPPVPAVAMPPQPPPRPLPHPGFAFAAAALDPL